MLLLLFTSDKLMCVVAGQLYEHAHPVQGGRGAASAACKALQPPSSSGPVNALGVFGGLPVLRVPKDGHLTGQCHCAQLQVLWLHRAKQSMGQRVDSLQEFWHRPTARFASPAALRAAAHFWLVLLSGRILPAGAWGCACAGGVCAWFCRHE